METSPSTIPNSAASSSDKQQQRKAGRVNRPAPSCVFCRTRKLKCDRKEPCANCVTRKETCSYAGSRRIARTTGTPGIRPQHVESMQERIDRLESLVTRLASQDNAAKNSGFEPLLVTNKISRVTPQNGTGPTVPRAHKDNPVDEIRHGVGVMKVGHGTSQYKGSTHWGDVFQELNELKNVWAQVQEVPENPDVMNLHTSFSGSVANDAPLLYSGFRPATFQEILATIPARQVLDKLIFRFFDGLDSPMTTLHCMHRGTFMQEYEAYWTNPEETSVMWIGMLFSVMTIVMLSYHLVEEEPPEYEGVSERLSDLYRLRTVQCLALGDITKCAPYTMEALLFYVISEQARKSDNGTGVWLMHGTILRVAQQMGYHRDPSQYPEISILQGEMRRRVWLFILRLDYVLSFQIGLPGMVRTDTFDTALPRSLYDWELSVEMKELPPSRPWTDITPVTFLLAKDGILVALSKIVNFLCTLSPYSYQKVLELDDELSLAQAQLPPFLQMRSMEESIHDPKSLIGRRVQLEILFHKGMCVLHRKFVAQGRIDGRFEPSRRRCIRSAMALMSIQDILYQEAGGNVDERIRFAKHWYRFSFTSQDFILSAMILCLDLTQMKVHEPNGILNAGVEFDQESKIAAIKKAFQIWKYAQRSLPEAIKVYRVLSYVIEMLGIADKVGLQEDPSASGEPTSNRVATKLLHKQTQIQLPNFENANPEDIMNIDWAMWDSFLEGTSFDDAFSSVLSPPTTNSTDTTHTF